MQEYRTGVRILVVVFVLYGVLVATHRGEFWPFSIYPMFSQAGTPWTRALVRQVPDADAVKWEDRSLDTLPGTPFRTESRGIAQSDLANYVGKTDHWTQQRLRGLRSVLSGQYDFASPLLVFRVRGRLLGDSVAVTARPMMVYTGESVRLNPAVSGGADSTAGRSQKRSETGGRTAIGHAVGDRPTPR